jgi:putative addiction module component (TIGR02574 family)
MSSTELSLAALELSPDERLELARRLVESVIEPASVKEAVAEGVRRIEDVASGRVQSLTQDQYRAALG